MQLYRVVTIGEQTWMAENLNYKVDTSFCYNEIESAIETENCTKYGRLYTWAAAIDSVKLYMEKGISCGYYSSCTLPDTVYGICPPGWHLPDTTEWNTLFDAVGGENTAAKMLKSQTVWRYNGYGTDDYGFSALPVVYVNGDGSFCGEGKVANFWTATGIDNPEAFSVSLYHCYEYPFMNYYGKDNAFSIRCLKDDP
jgi:uncharacterized protein (TIGR02145 family)